MALWGLFANIQSLKNHHMFFFPQNNGIVGGSDPLFDFKKPCLNHCCQAGDTRGEQSSSVSPDSSRQSSFLPLCLAQDPMGTL